MELHFSSPDATPLALNRRESLLEYLSKNIAEPTKLSRSEYEALTPGRKKLHDEARLAYLSEGLLVGTPSTMECKKALVRAFDTNRNRNSGHAGLMLSGASTLGKTTTAKGLMRWVLTEYTKQFPQWRASDHVPVVYVEVPAAANAKVLMKVFAEFLGLAVFPRDTADDIRVKVVAALRRANTQVVVVDELHNLDGRRAGLGEAADVLKGLSNDLTCTFIYAGIDLTDSGLMTGPRGQQLAARFTAVQLRAYDVNLAADRKVWRGIIGAFENKCTLLDHEPGTLKEHIEYLYRRTGGSIGALSRLLTGTAMDIIRNGGEEVYTQEAFDSYILDYAAESHRARSAVSSGRLQQKSRKSATKTADRTPTSPRFEAVKAEVVARGAA